MESITNWCVYMHENRINGKKYIGITGQKPTRRWMNGLGYVECPLFYKAIQKYGWDAFRHDILYTGLTLEEAERLEKELIAKYHTQDPALGYNISAGGGEINHGHHLSAEHRAKLRESNLGQKRSPETCRRVSEARQGKCTGAAHPNARRVRCVETGEVYDALAEAARQTGIDYNRILSSCRRARKTAGGYHWEYADTVVVNG